jgi:hypothetical protein
MNSKVQPFKVQIPNQGTSIAKPKVVCSATHKFRVRKCRVLYDRRFFHFFVNVDLGSMYDELFCITYPTNFIHIPFDQGSKFVHVSIVDTSLKR